MYTLQPFCKCISCCCHRCWYSIAKFWNCISQKWIHRFINTFLRNSLKFYGQKKRHHAQATLGRSFCQCKNPMKSWLNLRWKTMVRLLKLYLELGPYRCINNKYTPKNGGFFGKKRWKHTLRRWSYLQKSMKTH